MWRLNHKGIDLFPALRKHSYRMRRAAGNHGTLLTMKVAYSTDLRNNVTAVRTIENMQTARGIN
jgi:hypothetical protein